MAYISQITLPSGNQYEIKDAYARQAIESLSSPIHFLGQTTTEIQNGSTVNPIEINGRFKFAIAGDMVIHGNAEFIFGGEAWVELGDLSGLGELAYKNSASGLFTPAGTISQPRFSEGAVTASGSFTPSGEITLSTDLVTVVGGVTKSTGTVYGKTIDGSVTPGSAASINSGFFVSGTPASATFSQGTFTPNVPTRIDTSKFNAGTLPSKNEDTFDAGTLPSKEADIFQAGSQAELVTTVENEVLTISFTPNDLPTFTEGAFSQGDLPSFIEGDFSPGQLPELQAGFYSPGSAASKSNDTFNFVANTPGSIDTSKFNGGTPTSVVLPTFSQATFVTDVSTTSGTQNIPTSAAFIGTSDTISVTGTATGTVSAPVFSGTESQITVS